MTAGTGTVYFNPTTSEVTYSSAAATVSAAAPVTSVQFNSAGVLGGSSSLTWDGTNLSATQLVSTGSTTVGSGLTVTAGGILSNNRITILNGDQLRLGNTLGTAYVDIFG
jgi:hypothetical protein